MDNVETPRARTYLTVEEAATYLRLSRSMVYKLIERRQIPFIPYGRLRRFDPDALDRWVEQRSVDAKI